MKKKPKLDPNSNLMRSELMWEQPKKKPKFYKNWKLYAIALPVVAVVAGTGSGVYLGVNGSHKKTDLNNLDFVKTVSGTAGMDAVGAFDAFLIANQEKYPDLRNKVTYDKDPAKFSAPAYAIDGQLTVIPAKKSNYSGQIKVTISQMGQFDLTTLDQSTLTFDDLTPQTINENLVFDAFLRKQQNQDLSDLRDSVTLDFKPPTYNDSGSLVIGPKVDGGKYKNSINIPIAMFQRKKLADLVSSSIDGINTMVDSQSTLDAFFAISGNEKYRNFIEVEQGSFEAPSATKTGLLKIKVNSVSNDQPYSGDATITINKLTDLNGLGFSISLPPVEKEAEALEAFINANHKADELKNDVEIKDFIPSNYQNDSGKGSFKIVPKSGTKYDVNLPLEIKTDALPKTNWDSLEFVTTVSSNTTKETALQAFLDANKTDYPDLAGNVELVDDSFTLPGWGTKTGSYKIKAIDGDHKYEGDPLEISVLGKEQIVLDSLKNTALPGSEEMSEEDALQAFLDNNSISDSLAEFKEFVKVQFDRPGFVGDGSLKISALLNSDNKYSGEINVVVKEIGQTNWDSLKFVTTVSNDTTKETALQAFLDANKTDYPDLADNVELVDDSFIGPNTTTKGHYIIKATDNGKYRGEDLTITIGLLAKKDIKTLYSIAEIHGNLGDKNSSIKDLSDSAWSKFLEVNNAQQDDIKKNIKIVDVKDSSYTEDGYLQISAKTSEYTGTEDIKIISPGQKSLNNLDNLVRTVSSNTTKETALQAFLDANRADYPDLAGNVELDENSFVEPDSTTTTGEYYIKAKEGGEYKYKDSVKVTFPAKKSLFSVIIKNSIEEAIPDESKIIPKVLALNPDSGLSEEDLEVVSGSFVPSNGAVPGKVKIKAVNQNIFSADSVEITFGIMPIDRELKQLIDNIKKTTKNSNQERSAYNKYFDYYTNERLQNLADKLGTVYVVKKSLSLQEREILIEDQIRDNINKLLDQVIVQKDGLVHEKYGYDTYQGANVTGSFQPDGKSFKANINSVFVWNKRSDESNDYKKSKVSNLEFKIVYVD